MVTTTLPRTQSTSVDTVVARVRVFSRLYAGAGCQHSQESVFFQLVTCLQSPRLEAWGTRAGVTGVGLVVLFFVFVAVVSVAFGGDEGKVVVEDGLVVAGGVELGGELFGTGAFQEAGGDFEDDAAAAGGR